MDLSFILNAVNESARPEGHDEGVEEPIVPPAETAAEHFRPLKTPLRATQIDFSHVGNTPLDLFEQYFSDLWLQKLSDYTNKRFSRRRPAGRVSAHWRPTTPSEVALFLGSLIYMGTHRENALKTYWATGEWAAVHPLVRFFSRDRWLTLFRCFATHDPDDEEASRWPPFTRVDELSNHISHVSLSLITPGSNITIDEAMIGFTGRSKEATVVKGKPTPRGFRVWVVASDGYFLAWLWHANHRGPVGIPFPREGGKACPRQPRDDNERCLKKLNNTQQVVVALISKLPRLEYHVFLDNLFTSPNLLLYLRTFLRTATTGTARLSSGISKRLVKLKREDQTKDHIQWGTLEREPYPGGLINQFAWKDNALALFFSTFYTGDEEMVTRVHNRPKTKSRDFWGSNIRMEAPLPAFADEYNLKKGGVDRGDQLRSYNTWEHRVRRGRDSVFFLEYLLDVVLVNTYCLQKQAPKDQLPWAQASSQIDWRNTIFAEIFTKYGPDAGARQRTFDGTSHPGAARTALAEHHLFFRRKQSACLACQGKSMKGSVAPKKRRVLGEITQNTINTHHSGNRQPQPERKSTRWGCRACNIALCNSDKCWYFWHSAEPAETEVPRVSPK